MNPRLVCVAFEMGDRWRFGRHWLYHTLSGQMRTAGMKQTADRSPTAFFVLAPITMENVMAEPSVTRRAIKVEHVTITSTRTFAEVEAALEKSLPQMDQAIMEALARGDGKRASELAHGSELFIFEKRDDGILLRSAGQTRNAWQYEIGNPITASSMTQYQLPAALYAPLRLVLYENASGGTIFEYDLPSTLVGQFDDEKVTAVGLKLDAELERALRHAAD
jgi:hypothetical protein